MTTFNTNTDLNARGRQMMKARESRRDAGLASGRPDARPLHPHRARWPAEMAKAARREAARRSVDNLLR
jgi:hypothetical protein